MINYYYHGSTKFFTMLKPNSWVSIYPEDARVFATPWAVSSLFLTEEQRKVIPKNDLGFLTYPVYIYRIKTDRVIPAESNGGLILDWSWQTTDWVKVELIEYYPSWHKAIGFVEKNFFEFSNRT